ncbi:MAG: hypothetical protein K8T10_12500 [Candidatus Eremiobacteraeota bacterium]|nr:hypothetical protein [Candidatus Eremiobacteraeota bacterium]
MNSNEQNTFITKGKKIGITVLTNICLLLSITVWFITLLTMPSFVSLFQGMNIELPLLTQLVISFARFSRTMPGFSMFFAIPVLLFLVHLILSIVLSMNNKEDFSKKFVTFEVSLTYIVFIFILAYIIFFNISIALPIMQVIGRLH